MTVYDPLARTKGISLGSDSVIVARTSTNGFAVNHDRNLSAAFLITVRVDER